ncbi:MAG: magnesium and cobalt transport protein CorA [Clostridiales bacterium]|nr:magnesium and cobalt transport protein CorA [Clostridiales bacterium]
MVHILAITKDSELLIDVSLERLSDKDIAWYWVDFEDPDKEEVLLLSKHFKFDDHAIKDCLNLLERPKVNFYDSYNFFVLHSLDQSTYVPEELDVFLSQGYVVTVHKSKLQEINEVRQKITEDKSIWDNDTMFVLYLLLDKIVDMYFPAVFKIEDQLDEIDIRAENSRVHDLIDQVFSIRADLLKLRRCINSMKDLLYRMLNSEHLEYLRHNKRHFSDIYDHLLKLADTIESNREVTADMRDSYMSVNARRSNSIMTVLTVVTSIFIPLTFIVGVYGMNFDYMPELRWRYGYFGISGIMAAIGVLLFFWFKRKGWFDI